MNANGPAVGLSKRYPTQAPGRVLVPRASGARKLSRCEESTARFLPSRYKLCGLYECRGTRLIGSRKQVMVYKAFLRTLAWSRYKLLQICQGCKSKSKNRDELMNYTVRVSSCNNLIFFRLGRDTSFTY